MHQQCTKLTITNCISLNMSRAVQFRWKLLHIQSVYETQEQLQPILSHTSRYYTDLLLANSTRCSPSSAEPWASHNPFIDASLIQAPSSFTWCGARQVLKNFVLSPYTLFRSLKPMKRTVQRPLYIGYFQTVVKERISLKKRMVNLVHVLSLPNLKPYF